MPIPMTPWAGLPRFRCRWCDYERVKDEQDVATHERLLHPQVFAAAAAPEAATAQASELLLESEPEAAPTVDAVEPVDAPPVPDVVEPETSPAPPSDRRRARRRPLADEGV